MYLGEGAGGVKCVATRGDGGGGGRAMPETVTSGSTSGSWAFDSRKMVLPFFSLYGPFLR